MLGAAWSLTVALVAEPPAVPSPEPPKPATWELQWDAPRECPADTAIAEQIAALVPSPTGGEGVLVVDARVEPRDGGYLLTLRTEFLDRHDEREVRAPACDELAEAVALVVAISLDPSLELAGGAVPEPEPAPEPEPTPSDTGVPTDVGDRSTPDRATIRALALPRKDAPERRGPRARSPDAWHVRLGPQLEIGTLPPFGGGIDLAVGLAWRWVRLEIHGAWLWPRRASGPSSSGGIFQLGLAGARGCARPRAGRVELPVCVGLDAGAVRVDGVNLDPARTVHGPWLSPNVGVGLSVGGARVAFFTLLEASAAVVRPRILVGEDTFFRSSVVAGRWLAGLELRFAAKTGS
jgi:hypothetical protein